jgi:maltose O-acetyltransferase
MSEDLPASRKFSPSGFFTRGFEVLWGEMQSLSPRLMAVQLAVRFLPRLSFGRLRSNIYKLAGCKIGRSSIILGVLQIGGEKGAVKRLTIGDRCVINSPCFFDLNAPITLGDDVSLGHHVVLVTSSHLIGAPIRRAGLLTQSPITIGDGAWIGACSTLLPGVTIGKGAIVTAGSVVGADVPPNKLVGGVPARIIKALPEIS